MDPVMGTHQRDVPVLSIPGFPHRKITPPPHHHQGVIRCNVKIEVEKEEETYPMGEEPFDEENVTLQNTDGFSNRNSPERCPHPLYFRDYTQEAHEIPHYDQPETLDDLNIIVKEEVKENLDVKEEMEEESAIPMMTDEEDNPAEIGADGQYVKKTSEGRSLSLDCDMDEDDFPEDNLVKFYTCPECDKCFSQNSTLLQHRRTHTGEKPFLCPECGKSFTRKSILIEHRRIHTGEKPFSCWECGKCFTQRSGLILHHKTHGGAKKFPCSGCGAFFMPMTNFEMGEQTFCFKCQKLFPPVAHLSEEEKTFDCTECGKCFSRKSTLLEHQRVHTGEKPYSCSECDKSFTRKYILVEHQRIHTGEKPFSCSQCWKSFSKSSGLLMHQKIHALEKTFPCSECGKDFTQRSKTLSGEDGSSCPECKISSSRNPRRPPKLHTCTECSKTFRYKSYLITHLRSHTGVKPFTCPVCGKSFTQKSGFDTHQRVHTGEKPFSCLDCGRRFTQKSKLVYHQRGHSKERPRRTASSDPRAEDILNLS
ncbi:uncharacterized protein [Aquarana catesbeiana]|uniref:uncharacterized protein n=1 Tax=Aquarana catesbeiana TaxID=8400 RepID=UPI003CC973A6